MTGSYCWLNRLEVNLHDHDWESGWSGISINDYLSHWLVMTSRTTCRPHGHCEWGYDMASLHIVIWRYIDDQFHPGHPGRGIASLRQTRDFYPRTHRWENVPRRAVGPHWHDDFAYAQYSVDLWQCVIFRSEVGSHKYARVVNDKQ
jgi:hypothetical protein